MYYLVMVNPYEIRTADVNGEQAEAISLTFFFQEKHDKIDTVYIIFSYGLFMKSCINENIHNGLAAFPGDEICALLRGQEQ